MTFIIKIKIVLHLISLTRYLNIDATFMYKFQQNTCNIVLKTKNIIAIWPYTEYEKFGLRSFYNIIINNHPILKKKKLLL